jgi:hypothetical protein
MFTSNNPICKQASTTRCGVARSRVIGFPEVCDDRRSEKTHLEEAPGENPLCWQSRPEKTHTWVSHVLLAGECSLYKDS